MSQAKVDSITNKAGSGAPDFPNGVTTKGASVDSEIVLHTGSGHGSPGTKIRTFTTVQVNIGSALTLTQSVADGDSVTINTDGIYTITYSDRINGSTSGRMGISINASSLSTDIDSLAASEVLAYEFMGEAAANTQGDSTSVSVTRRLSAGDIIRPHDEGNNNNTDVGSSRFTVTQLVIL
jgi:hypothetical protein